MQTLFKGGRHMNMKATPYSNLKVFAHAEELNRVHKGERISPIYVRLKPTNYCNHHCYYCSYADSELGLRDIVHRQDQIPWEKMREIIDDFKDMGVKAVTFSGGGEPLVYPYIIETIQRMKEAGVEISIITNGQLLDGKRAQALKDAKWVRVSCDSANAETYAKVRKITLDAFDRVCDNIREFAKIKEKYCELGINFVINHENAYQVYDMAKLSKKLGANHIKFSARITKGLFEYHKPFKQDVIEQLHRAQKELEDDGFKVINKYEGDFDTAMVFARQYNKCYINNLVTTIAADCKVYFCHDKAYVSSGIVGDLKEKSFRELWFSDEVVKRYQEFDAQKECPHHCVYDDRNILLNTLYGLDENQINFI